VLGINPANGQGALPITTSVLAELTPVSACLVGDTFKNVVTAPIDPNNPNAGIQVTSADIATPGNFYLEELDASGNAVRHVPVQLQSLGDTFNSTTVATLRLGLASPLSQYFLKSKTNYRATLLGADASSPAGAVCNASNQSPLAKTYQWTFQSVFTCVNDVAPTATLRQSAERQLCCICRGQHRRRRYLRRHARAGFSEPHQSRQDSHVHSVDQLAVFHDAGRATHEHVA
jgi:hypothetical protein